MWFYAVGEGAKSLLFLSIAVLVVNSFGGVVSLWLAVFLQIFAGLGGYWFAIKKWRYYNA